MKKNYFLKVLLITVIGLGTNLNAQTTTWTGATSSNFNLSTNWDNGSPDGTVKDVVIPDVTNDPIIDSDNIIIYGSFTLAASATLIITEGGSFTQPNLIGSPTFTNNGTIIINSGSEFKTSSDDLGSGSFTYNRNLATTNWYLVSSPFEGQDIDNFITAENPPSLNGDVALAPYNTSDNTWTYIQTGASGSGNFITGKGYSVKLQSSGDISFTGSLLTSNKSVALESSGQGYNLIGNPYPIHIKSTSILTRNSASLDSETIWVWNDDVDAYQAKTSGTGGWNVAPAQAFFVKSDGASGTVEIHETDQISAADTFLRTDPLTEISLTLSNESASRQATIYYIDDTTTGFDNGYDGPRFMAGDNSFAFYTHLVSDGEGVDYDIQSLPTDNYENMVIPLGINAVSGTDITLNISTINFPEGINTYLEDKVNNSFTLLDANSNFMTTLDSDLNGIGRFYLHTTSEVLSSDDFLNNNISIYISSKDNLRIVGIHNGTAEVQLYNILGKEVFSAAFEGTGMNDIQLPNIKEGIYIINLTTDKGTINKKVIIH